jgi:hypothetical protein
MTGIKIWKACLFHNINEGESLILNIANGHDCIFIPSLTKKIVKMTAQMEPPDYLLQTYLDTGKSELPL